MPVICNEGLTRMNFSCDWLKGHLQSLLVYNIAVVNFPRVFEAHIKQLSGKFEQFFNIPTCMISSQHKDSFSNKCLTVSTIWQPF